MSHVARLGKHWVDHDTTYAARPRLALKLLSSFRNTSADGLSRDGTPTRYGDELDALAAMLLDES